MPGRRKWLVFFGMFGGVVQTHEWCRCQLLGRISWEEKQFGSSGRTRTYNPSVNSYLPC